MVFPRSPPPRTKMLHCCRSNAQLQHREMHNPLLCEVCQDMTQLSPFSVNRKGKKYLPAIIEHLVLLENALSLICVGGAKVLTHGLAGPLPFAVSQTDTLQHVVGCVVRSFPRVPNFVRPSTFMATVWRWQLQNLHTLHCQGALLEAAFRCQFVVHVSG